MSGLLMVPCLHCATPYAVQVGLMALLVHQQPRNRVGLNHKNWLGKEWL